MEAGDAETGTRLAPTVVGVLLRHPFTLPAIKPHQGGQEKNAASMSSSSQQCGDKGVVPLLSTVWKSESNSNSEGSLIEDSRSWSSTGRSNMVTRGSPVRQGHDSSASACEVSEENPLRSTSPSARTDAPCLEGVEKLSAPYESRSFSLVTLMAVWAVCVLLQIITVVLSAVLSVVWAMFLTAWLLLGMFLFYTKVTSLTD